MKAGKLSRRKFLKNATVGTTGLMIAPSILSIKFKEQKNMIKLGINMEFVRSHDMSFTDGVKKAAEIGYEYCEPIVHWGRELLSEAGYFHSVSMFNDPLLIKDICDRNKIKISGLSSHTPLCKPEISLEYLKQAIRFAAEMGVSVVNTDEGPKPEWTTREMDYCLMKYTLTEAARVAERQSNSERGKVSGTPVGCACGDGVVDWKRVIDIVKSSGREIVFSVECGTIEQAIRSFKHLSPLL